MLGAIVIINAVGTANNIITIQQCFIPDFFNQQIRNNIGFIFKHINFFTNIFKSLLECDNTGRRDRTEQPRFLSADHILFFRKLPFGKTKDETVDFLFINQILCHIEIVMINGLCRFYVSDTFIDILFRLNLIFKNLIFKFHQFLLVTAS
ncbi:hypothetical protein SDC9_166461 [bioreactor metagenome]|uniref:Uncharacterized protein n=1 Tax=bioreactor metagenome TaxID=1076179 RepID=A0A645FXC2_9ZZZZ